MQQPRITVLLSTAFLGAAFLVGGCKDDTSDTTPAVPSVPSDTTPAPAPSDAGAAAADAAADVAAAAQTKAKELFDQGLAYVNENKLDLAEGALKQLEGMKDQLPADWAPRIDQLRSAISTAKAAGGTLPGGK